MLEAAKEGQNMASKFFTSHTTTKLTSKYVIERNYLLS